MADKAPDDDMKARFREALDRKAGKGADGKALVDGDGKAINHGENVAKRQPFRRRAGGGG